MTVDMTFEEPGLLPRNERNEVHVAILGGAAFWFA
jgi:hypothetical protein